MKTYKFKLDKKLYYGDNLDVLRKYIGDESVDLCYIDPPFNSKRNYNQIYNNIGGEDRAQAQAFIDTWEWTPTTDEEFAQIVGNTNKRFTKQSINLILLLQKVLGKGSLMAYLISMTLRIVEIYRVLKPTGSFYFHCDPTSSHYLKIIIDAIFCPQGGDYKNEISWCYKERELSKKTWNKKHDIIFFYVKSDKYTFNYDEVREPYSDYTLEKKFKYKDEKGFYRLRYKDGRNDPVVEGENTYRQYTDKGVLARDWWSIPILNQAAKERLGYPTQKPETLLEKIIKASSNEGDVVLDAYCGCGTTIAVAERLGRKWIGIDITYQSISLILKRLEEHFGIELLPFIELNGIPKDIKSAIALANKKDDRTRKEFEKWAVLTFTNNKGIINEKKGGDGGIDGIAFIADLDTDNEQIVKEALFSVKSDQIIPPSRIRELNGTIEREGAALGYFITLYPMNNLVRESHKYGMYNNIQFDHTYPKIKVVSVQDILDGARMDLPISMEVLKKAGNKYQPDQTTLEF